MKTIVCYGDSNTWGFKPEKDKPEIPLARYDYNIRWTGVLQGLLGNEYLVIEEGLNGRTTAFDDPLDMYRNGSKHIDYAMLTNMPVDIVIIMLGTNDVKDHFGVSAYIIGAGLEQLILKINNSDYGPNGEAPKILIISPAPLCENIKSAWPGEEFGVNALEKSNALADYYKRVADTHGCFFINAGDKINTDPLDAVHINAKAHNKLAHFIHETLMKMI